MQMPSCASTSLASETIRRSFTAMRRVVAMLGAGVAGCLGLHAAEIVIPLDEPQSHITLTKLTAQLFARSGTAPYAQADSYAIRESSPGSFRGAYRGTATLTLTEERLTQFALSVSSIAPYSRGTVRENSSGEDTPLSVEQATYVLSGSGLSLAVGGSAEVLTQYSVPSRRFNSALFEGFSENLPDSGEALCTISRPTASTVRIQVTGETDYVSPTEVEAGVSSYLAIQDGIILDLLFANQAPTISSIAPQTVSVDGSSPGIAFAVSDTTTPVQELLVSVSSSDPVLLPVGGIIQGGSGANRSLTLTPTAGRAGSCIVTVSVSDGLSSTTTSFALHVTGVPTASRLWLPGFVVPEIGFRMSPAQVASHVARVMPRGFGSALFYQADDESIWACGLNATGQLGDGSVVNRSTPVRVATGAIAASAGWSHTLILSKDGVLMATGDGASGQLGEGLWVRRTSPVPVATAIAAIAAGGNHTLLLQGDGTLLATGNNTVGQLGDGTTNSRNAPVVIASGVAKMHAGASNSYFIKSDGTLWATGRNDHGQLGDGTTTDRRTPVQIATNVVSVSESEAHVLFVRADGTLWACGRNHLGQLGTGDMTDRSSPVQIGTQVAQAHTAGHVSAFIKTDGSLWVMGANDVGQLGTGDRTHRTSPVQIATSVTSVAPDYGMIAFLKTDGTLWTQGGNASGQLGDGTSMNRTTAVPIASGVSDVVVGAGALHYLKTDGTLWTAGDNRYGQLGDGAFAPPHAEVANDILDVAFGTFSGLFVDSARALWAFHGGQIHRMTGVTEVSRVAVGTYDSARLYLRTDRTLWSLDAADVPTQLASDVVAIGAGFSYIMYLAADGTLWGRGGDGWAIQFGDGSSWVPVATGVASFSCAAFHALIVKADYTLWGIGTSWNGWGPGNSNSTVVTTPVPLRPGVRSAAAFDSQNLYVTLDNRLWRRGDGWGGNADPEVEVDTQVAFAAGGGDSTDRCHYVKLDGTYWTCAVRGSTRAAPVQIATSVSHVAAGSAFSTAYLQDLTGVSIPTLLAQPASKITVAGHEATLRVEVAEDAASTFQWQRLGQPTEIFASAAAQGRPLAEEIWIDIEGATDPTLSFPSLQAYHVGTYRVVISSGSMVATSDPATISVAAPPASDARLLNISTRALCQTDDSIVIPGFVISGTGTKKILIRGVGPRLTGLGVPDALPDPTLTLKRDTGGGVYVTLDQNDDWGTNTNKSEIITVSAQVFAFSLPDESKDSALLVDLPAGAYTVPTAGANDVTGVSLVELYDADVGSPGARLINISNRGFVGIGGQIMIPGFVVSNEGSRTFLIRAVGPRLAGFGIQGVLEDPEFTVYRRVAGVDEPILSNDDWGTGADATQTAAVARQVFAFSLAEGSKDAAFVVTLPPGAYTVNARGKNDTTGVALVEVYLVP